MHLIEQTIDKLKTEKTIVVIDPVMADNGELYAIFSKEFPKEMAKLCKKADLLIPNLTEASLPAGRTLYGRWHLYTSRY